MQMWTTLVAGIAGLIGLVYVTGLKQGQYSRRLVYGVGGFAVANLTFSLVHIIRKKFWLHHIDPWRLLRKKQVFVIDNDEQWNRHIEDLQRAKDELPVLGLDCEWTSETQSKVSLLQLASCRGLCLLVRLSKFSSDPLPQSLLELLSDGYA
ncbi:unnamed protein product [Darwinula stevensoni]|uniref:3'-5' exonuclease domain-containing protein n=1 Tax=Darwinula stevensoni TaxID=69355 RepID=A0A7R9FRB1_9CRUS|nr:unnamed protein product [Darwinula stevensoni]CAG0901332.1 unnamed protein product [Darwinula stevensoni]